MPSIYSCGSKEICAKTFDNRGSLNSHCKAKKHINPWLSTDTTWNASGNALAVRSDTIHGPPNVAISYSRCSKCPRMFDTPRMLARHDKIKHQGLPCTLCGSVFNKKSCLRDHMSTIHPSSLKPASHENKPPSGPATCQVCERSFLTPGGLQSHIQVPGKSHRFDCPVCQVKFKAKHELGTHLNTAEHAAAVAADQIKRTCQQCKRKFTTMTNLANHVKSTNHIYIAEPTPSSASKTHIPVAENLIGLTCSLCQVSFPTKEALDMHLRFPGDTHMYKCNDCKMTFKRKIKFDQHNEHPRHTMTVTLKQSAELTCKICKRSFKSYHSLANHILSRAPGHNGDLSATVVPAAKLEKKGHQSIANRPRDMKCVFCTNTFKSPSGIAHHIESGVHKYHRHHVTVAIKSMGVVPQITIKDYTNSATPPPVPTITSYVATAAAFTGSAYACFLCTATFKTLPALNSHLNSAAHDASEFKCPNAKCSREFTLISGLIQHLESRCCGLAPLVEIDGYFEKLEEHFSRTMEMRQIGPSA